MADQQQPTPLDIRLEIVPEDVRDADPAEVSTVGLNVVDALKKDGYIVQPSYTGERGGVFFLIIAGIELAAQQAWTHKDQLIEIFKAIAPIAKSLLDERDKPAAKDNNQPIKVAIKIEDASINVEAPDLESVQSIMKLANSFRTHHPRVAENVTHRSTITVQGRVTKTQPRRRK